MSSVSLEYLEQQLELSEQLLLGHATMLEPQDLPGRFGRAIKAVDHILKSILCEGLLAGGWAVWRHGYIGRVTQDVDIVLPADRIDEFLRIAAVSGFEVLSVPEGMWPKVRHKDTGLQVDILPEGGRPGTTLQPAATTIPHPKARGARPGSLQYVSLPFLIELKLAAGRARDDADIIELMRAQPEQAEGIREHLEGIHADYVIRFDSLLDRARAQRDA